MKHFLPLALAVGVLSTIRAEDAPAPAAPASDVTAETTEDFQKREPGALPDELMQQQAEPLDDGVVLLGKSLKNGGVVKAKIKASSKRRSAPRMGVGIGGTSGYRFRLVPAEKKVELSKEDGRLIAVDFAWKPDAWFWVEISVVPAKEAGKWNIEGRAWEDGQQKPEAATVSQTVVEKPPGGKASVVGTPFSQQPIQFDDVTIKPGS
jgi:hypothetical protein